MGFSMDLFSDFFSLMIFVLLVATGGTPGGCGLRLSNGS